MSIEFNCSACNELLKTPDESAGQSAKCPFCSAVVDVPSNPFSSDGTTPGPALDAPTAEFQPGSNPYAAPTSSTSTPYASTGAVLEPTAIDFQQVISRTWEIFKTNLGPLVLCGVIIFGVSIAGQLITIPMSVLPAIYPNNISVFVAVQVFQQLWGVVVGAVTISIAMRFMMALLRGNPEPFKAAFKIWPAVLKVLGVQVLFTLLIFAGAALFAGLPALIAYLATQRNEFAVIAGIVGGLVYLPIYIYIAFRMLMAQFLIIDRDSGVFESMTDSGRFAKGNTMSMFAIMFVLGIGSLVVTVFTCGIGMLFAWPFSFLALGIIYMTATGQWPRTAFAATVP